MAERPVRIAPGVVLLGGRVLYPGMSRATDGERTTSEGLAERGLLDYLRILWRHKLLIALTVIVTTGAAVGLDRVRHRTYQGTAEVLFTFQGASGLSSSSSSNLSPADVATDIELIQSAPVQAAVAKKLHTTAPPVTATEVGTTNVAQIAVRSTSPDFAAAAANAYARAYIQVATQGYIKSQLAAEQQLQEQSLTLQGRINTILQTPGSATSAPLQSQLSGLYTELSSVQQQLGQLQLTTAQGASAGQLVVPAVPNPVPVSPKRVQDAVIAIGVGLLLGIGFALLRENLDDRVRGKDRLEQLMPGIPVLGLIPVIDKWRDRKRPYLVAQTQPRSPPSEAYRGLRTSVQFMALETPTKVLQITSPSAGDGKTTTSANLAWIMADAGQRVVVMGCDLRQPRIHEFFGLPNDVGFTSVLLGEAELDDALLSVPNQPGLLMLPTGPVPPNPSELLSSARTQQVFKSLGTYADMVIVDSAPVLPVTDAAVLSTHADAILLVVSVGMDKGRDVVRSVEMLNQINAPIAGIVLNRAPETDSSAYYRYRYEEKSSYKGKPKDDKPRKRDAPAPTNGNGKVAHDLSPVKNLPAIEDENVDSAGHGAARQGRTAAVVRTLRGSSLHRPETLPTSSGPFNPLRGWPTIFAEVEVVLRWFGLTAGMASPEDQPLSRGTARFVLSIFYIVITPFPRHTPVPAKSSSQPKLVDPAFDPADVPRRTLGTERQGDVGLKGIESVLRSATERNGEGMILVGRTARNRAASAAHSSMASPIERRRHELLRFSSGRATHDRCLSHPHAHDEPRQRRVARRPNDVHLGSKSVGRDTQGPIDQANAGRSMLEHGFDGDDGQHAESTRCRSRC